MIAKTFPFHLFKLQMFGTLVNMLGCAFLHVSERGEAGIMKNSSKTLCLCLRLGLYRLDKNNFKRFCTHAKVRSLKGIPALVQLYSSENQEVQRYATGATRNLIYENMENKAALIEAGGISKLVCALKEPDDELRKNVTGITCCVLQTSKKVETSQIRGKFVQLSDYKSNIRLFRLNRCYY